MVVQRVSAHSVWIPRYCIAKVKYEHFLLNWSRYTFVTFPPFLISFLFYVLCKNVKGAEFKLDKLHIQSWMLKFFFFNSLLKFQILSLHFWKISIFFYLLIMLERSWKCQKLTFEAFLLWQQMEFNWKLLLINVKTWKVFYHGRNVNPESE